MADHAYRDDPYYEHNTCSDTTVNGVILERYFLVWKKDIFCGR